MNADTENIGRRLQVADRKALGDSVNLFAIRHGETAWSLSGQHTGPTDIPLTARPAAGAADAAGVGKECLCARALSPMQRARETCKLAGFGDKAVIEPDLMEWNYGEYEGLTTEQIHEAAPGWLLFRDGRPGGETPAEVVARGPGDRPRARSLRRHRAVRARPRAARAGGAMDRPAGGDGQHSLLDTGTLCVLGDYRGIPAVRVRNGPLID